MTAKTNLSRHGYGAVSLLGQASAPGYEVLAIRAPTRFVHIVHSTRSWPCTISTPTSVGQTSRSGAMGTLVLVLLAHARGWVGPPLIIRSITHFAIQNRFFGMEPVHTHPMCCTSTHYCVGQLRYGRSDVTRNRLPTQSYNTVLPEGLYIEVLNLRYSVKSIPTSRII